MSRLPDWVAGAADDTIKANDQAPTASRVLVVSASEFITNPFAYAGNGPDLGSQFAMFGNVGGDRQLLMIAGQYANRYLTNTILSIKNTLDWISGDADLLAASAKLISDPNITYRDVAKPKISAEDDEAPGVSRSTRSSMRSGAIDGNGLFGALQAKGRFEASEYASGADHPGRGPGVHRCIRLHATGGDPISAAGTGLARSCGYSRAREAFRLAGIGASLMRHSAVRSAATAAWRRGA